jgi:tetratricopeptide (TPR) repeat protein
MSRIQSALLLALTSIVGLTAQSPRSSLLDLTDRLERAVLADDVGGLRQSRAGLLQLLSAASAAEAPAIRYAVAYADWRQSTNPSVPSREQDGLLDEAEQQLKELLKAQPQAAEALALISSVYGMKIAHSPIKGMLLGSKSTNAIDSAMKVEPENPRVLIAKGVGKFNAPGMFGGSEKEAEILLRKALAQLAAQPADKAFPAWGRFDAHAWLGQILAKRGDKTGARSEYDQALQIAPQSGWIRYVLIPALDKR